MKEVLLTCTGLPSVALGVAYKRFSAPQSKGVETNHTNSGLAPTAAGCPAVGRQLQFFLSFPVHLDLAFTSANIHLFILPHLGALCQFATCLTSLFCPCLIFWFLVFKSVNMQRALTSRAATSVLSPSAASRFRSSNALSQQLRFAHKVR